MSALCYPMRKKNNYKAYCCKTWSVCLESLKYDRNRPNVGLSQIECYPLGKTCETESKAFPLGSPLDYSDISGQSSESRFH